MGFLTLPFSLIDILGDSEGARAAAGITVAGVNADSRLVGKGEAFFALPGTRGHGVLYAHEAVGRGASVIVTDEAPQTDPGVPLVLVEDVRAAYARAAAETTG